MKKLDLQDLAGFITLGILFMLFWIIAFLLHALLQVPFVLVPLPCRCSR